LKLAQVLIPFSSKIAINSVGLIFDQLGPKKASTFKTESFGSTSQ
jgi:hypothetical protein